ncbi:MAG TPA: acetate--CoA ligase family protein [Streptosporangiaceae bacterium]|nr:acetate--CoA ligase family protein [Streptosporangiaceae bacterium]
MAIVGASDRPGSFGARMIAEVGKSAAKPASYLVNPRYREIGGQRCYPSVADLPGAPDLVLLGVPDAALHDQLTLAATLGCRSAVIFGSAHENQPRQGGPARGPAGAGRPAGSPASGLAGACHPTGSPSGRPPDLRQRLAATATTAGMELCGAGCMGFANVGHGLRAMGYIEPDPLPAGPVALVTHSGSVFSALLRSRRAFGFTLAVSSGQELVTPAAAYLSYALARPQTRVLALVLEAMRQPDELREVLAQAAGRDVPVVLLTAGGSASGRAMVAAHSGALAGSDGGWEALARGYGIHRVTDLAELADTLELFSLRTTRSRRAPAQPGRRAPAGAGRRGIAAVHDSGLERAHVADLADELGVPFAKISDATKARLAGLLDAGLTPANPLDVWGTGASTRELFAGSLTALAEDDAVDAVAFAVDLITELDGDDAYPLAALDAARRTAKPLAVISNLASGIDAGAAGLLREHGIPVLEGTRTGLLAFRHLLDAADRTAPAAAAPPPRAADPARTARAHGLLARCARTGAAHLALLREYGIVTAEAERVTSVRAALAAAGRFGYPVVLKTDQPGVAHKSDAGGVVLGIGGDAGLAAAYADLAARLGPAALVCRAVPPGTELALGIVRDPSLGPLVVVGAGGVLVELIGDRAVALPPVTAAQAAGLLDGLKVRRLLAGARGAPPADLGAVGQAIAGLSALACELGDQIEALDINPLICGPHGAIAVDALVVRRQR